MLQRGLGWGNRNELRYSRPDSGSVSHPYDCCGRRDIHSELVDNQRHQRELLVHGHTHSEQYRPRISEWIASGYVSFGVGWLYELHMDCNRSGWHTESKRPIHRYLQFDPVIESNGLLRIQGRCCGLRCWRGLHHWHRDVHDRDGRLYR